MLLIHNDLSGHQRQRLVASKNHFAAQAIEIRGFRLTQAFPLAYDDSRVGKAERAFFPDYAILDLASGTVLDRGNVAPRGGLDTAWSPEFAYTPRKCAH